MNDLRYFKINSKVIILNDFRTKLIYISLLKQQFLSAGLRNPKTLRKEKYS
jgi:hypothetical protein